jgi:hypothetical protein
MPTVSPSSWKTFDLGMLPICNRPRETLSELINSLELRIKCCILALFSTWVEATLSPDHGKWSGLFLKQGSESRVALRSVRGCGNGLAHGCHSIRDDFA